MESSDRVVGIGVSATRLTRETAAAYWESPGKRARYEAAAVTGNVTAYAPLAEVVAVAAQVQVVVPGGRVFSQTVLPAIGAPAASSIVPAKVTSSPEVGAVSLAVRARVAGAGTLASAIFWSWLREPLKTSVSTLPLMPGTRPELEPCQNDQVGQPPGTVGWETP